MLERAPLMHWIADWRREKVSWHHSQDIVILYDWSHSAPKQEANLLLKKTVASLAMPPVADKTSGVMRSTLSPSLSVHIDPSSPSRVFCNSVGVCLRGHGDLILVHQSKFIQTHHPRSHFPQYQA